MGDCPFTHFVMMTMALKGVGVVVRPCGKDVKPAWLLEKHGGSLPCLTSDLENGEGAVSDSTQIAKFVDETLGESKLSGVANADAMAATGSLFGAIAKFLKNTDDSLDESLHTSLEEQLRHLEVFLRSDGHSCAPRRFLAHEETPGLADASVAPKLFVLQVAGSHYKKYTLDKGKFPDIAAYQDRVFALPAFQSTRPRENEIIHGWGQGRAGGH